MNNSCPKCGEKLGVFYLKQSCPKCGVNLVYFNMEERLDSDSKAAEAEWARVSLLLDKITPKFVKNKRSENREREKISAKESGDEKTD